MTNQTTVAREKVYPKRVVLAADEVSWEIELPDYNPAIYPSVSRSQQLLEKHNIVIASAAELRKLGTLSTRQAIELHGPSITNVRHPLGRTGINGTGNYQAGQRNAAALAMRRSSPDNHPEVALVLVKGKWRLPGGFEEVEDGGSRRAIAVRKSLAETHLDMGSLADHGQISTLVDTHVKARSSRSLDLAYVTNWVGIVDLPDWRHGNNIKRDDAADAVRWVTSRDLGSLVADDMISPDHAAYTAAAFAFPAHPA